MSIGRLEQRYEFELQGVKLLDEMQFHVPEYSLRARLQHSGTPLSLFLRIEGTTQAEGEGRAALFVQELYRRLLLRFAPRIHGAMPPRCIDQAFRIPATDSSPFGVTRTPVTGKITVEGQRPIVGLSSAELGGLAAEVRLRLVTPQVPTSAQLYTAIDMFIIGLESPNRVVRFLVFYSAMQLAALFKWHQGWQEKVDELIRERNPDFPSWPSPKKKRKPEGLYTKLRNDLIHAGERGIDAAGAIAAIEAHIDQFQRDASAVLLNL
jgi:hypothetical protein